MGAHSFRADIQGIRAIAVLSVVIFHFNSSILPSGYVGVDMFLVISGYLMSSILMKYKASMLSMADIMRAFYRSRVKRIVPAYLFMLVVCGLVASVLFTETDFSYFKDSLTEALFFKANQYFSDFGSYFSPALFDQPLLHTWSLAVEMQFYLLYPLFILGLSKKWLRVVIPILIVICIGISEYQLRFLGETQKVYYSLYSRIPEFLLGSIPVIYNIKILKQTNKNLLSFVGLLLLLFGFVGLNHLSKFPGMLALFPALGVLLLLISDGGVPTKWLKARILVGLGAVSYSLYLWHWPVLVFIRYITGVENFGIMSSSLFVFLTLLFTVISYYLVEHTSHSIQKKPLPLKSRQASLLLTGLVILVFISLNPVASFINKALAPQAFPVEYTRYADPKEICHGKVAEDCFRGDVASEHRVLVLGDSHGAMLNYSFDIIGLNSGVAFKVITASNCVTIPDFDIKRLVKWAQKPCKAQIDIATKLLAEYDSIVIAGMWSFHTPSSEFMFALERFIESHPRKHILLLSQVPELLVEPSRINRFEYIGIKLKQEINKAVFESNEEVSRITSRYPNATYIDSRALELFKQTPLYNGELMYFDESHINEIGAKEYGYQLAAQLSKMKINFYNN